MKSGDKKGKEMGPEKAWTRAAMLDFATASQLGKLVVVSRDTVMAVQLGSGWEQKRVWSMVAVTAQLMEQLKDSGKEMVKEMVTEVLTAASMDVSTDEH